MERLDDLLTAAISSHREVLRVYEEIDLACLSGDGKALASRVDGLTPALDTARQADQAVLDHLDGEGSSYQHLQLMREYQELLRQAAARNKTLLEHARVHCALAAAELVELRQGKAALAGYRPLSEVRGGRLCEAY